MLEKESNIPQSDRDFKVEGNAELKSEHESMFLRLSTKLDEIDDLVTKGRNWITKGEDNPARGGIEVNTDWMWDKVSEQLRPLVQEARGIIEEIRNFEKEKMDMTEDSRRLVLESGWLESLAEEGWKIN